VPCSACIALLLGPPVILYWFPVLAEAMKASDSLQMWFYAGVGIVSYHFPFGAVKLVLTNAVMKIIEEALREIDRHAKAGVGKRKED
jgi:hypothetical protein